MAFQTPLHILLVINKFTELKTLKTTFKNKFDTVLKTFEKYSKDNSRITNEIKNIFQHLKILSLLKL